MTACTESWPFLTSKLVIDQPSIPLIESSFSHFVALEVICAYLIFSLLMLCPTSYQTFDFNFHSQRHVSALAEDFKKRPEGTFTLPLQIQYMCEIPNSPQLRCLLN